MKLLILLIFSILCSFGFSQSNQGCGKYKTGIFEIDNKDGTVSTIKRTKKFQFEKSAHFQGKDKIKWIDDCTFQLIPIKTVDETGIVGTDILTVHIVNVGEHHYTFEITGVGDNIILGKVYEKGFLDYDKK